MKKIILMIALSILISCNNKSNNTQNNTTVNNNTNITTTNNTTQNTNQIISQQTTPERKKQNLKIYILSNHIQKKKLMRYYTKLLMQNFKIMEYQIIPKQKEEKKKNK